MAEITGHFKTGFWGNVFWNEGYWNPAGAVALGVYNLYVGAGTLNGVDFDTIVESFPGGTSSGSLVGYGFDPSTEYTLVMRPELDSGLETPDTSAQITFRTDGAGEWVGNIPEAATRLSVQAVAGAVIRLKWYHRTIDGATPDDFLISYGEDST